MSRKKRRKSGKMINNFPARKIETCYADGSRSANEGKIRRTRCPCARRSCAVHAALGIRGCAARPHSEAIRRIVRIAVRAKLCAWPPRSKQCARIVQLRLEFLRIRSRSHAEHRTRVPSSDVPFRLRELRGAGKRDRSMASVAELLLSGKIPQGGRPAERQPFAVPAGCHCWRKRASSVK